MKKKTVKVPKGKDLLLIWVTSHTYVVRCDKAGHERFRFQSKGKHITIVVEPGEYTLETDGEFKKISLEKIEPNLEVPKTEDLLKPIEP